MDNWNGSRKGVKRRRCRECDECDDYEYLGSKDNSCSYCGCSPDKHGEAESITEDESDEFEEQSSLKSDPNKTEISIKTENTESPSAGPSRKKMSLESVRSKGDHSQLEDFNITENIKFAKEADTCFMWTVKDLKGSGAVNLPTQTFQSLSFTTSLEPAVKWHLLLSVNTTIHCTIEKRLSKKNPPTYVAVKDNKVKKMIHLKVVRNEAAFDPVQIKIDISIMNGLKKMYTRSLIVSESLKEYSINNFIDWVEMMKIVCDGEVKIYVEMFFQEYERSLDFSSDLDFLSDIEISISGEKFHAHKAILAAKSPFFYNLFKQNKEIKEINNLDSINPDAFKEILRYIYSDNYCLSSDVLLGASILQLEDLQTRCEHFLKRNITVDVVCPILILALKCDTKFLLKHCLYFAVKNINTLKNIECFRTEPLVMLAILKDIFYNCSVGNITIVDHIRNTFIKSETNMNSSFSQDYEPFFNNESLSDVRIKVGEKTFRAHKLVLSAKCPVFSRMLMSNMKEALNDVIEIVDMEVEVFEQILRYMYTGEVKNLEEYAISILQAAEQYNLNQLKTTCEEFLAEKLTHENVVDIVKLADTFQASLLKKCCIHYIIQQTVLYAHDKKATNIVLNNFSDNHSDVLFEILRVLSSDCVIQYT